MMVSRPDGFHAPVATGAVCLLVACPCESSRIDWLKSRAPQVPVTLGYAEGNLTVAEAAALDDICTANAREHLKVTKPPR